MSSSTQSGGRAAAKVKVHQEDSESEDDHESTPSFNGSGESSMSTLSLGTNPLTAAKFRKRKRKKKSKSVGNGKSSDRFQFKTVVKEDHGQPIFGCQFHQKLKKGEPLIMATVGSNRVSIYECLPEGPLNLLQVFEDPDKKEIFYCCAWSEYSGKPILAAAGAHGIIRILSPALAACVKHFVGHGNAINDLKFHPKNPDLLLSASKDHSLRLWNVKTDICIVMFSGVEGHRDEVLSADIQNCGEFIVSSGMDHALKVWKLEKPEITSAIRQSYTHNTKKRPFRTLKEHYPVFSTRNIHKNYVDCVKWYGDFILSKSCENNIVCWKGGKVSDEWKDVDITTTQTTLIHELDLKHCEVWYMRFCMDFRQRILVLGNQRGKTYVYDLETDDPSEIKCMELSNSDCNTAIRQTALSRDGEVLICVCDDGTVWRWDANVNNVSH